MVMITLFDFSSAFDMVQPVQLSKKLSVIKVYLNLEACITDYLMDRLQYVKLQHCLSDVVKSNTGTPKGTLLPLFLLILYTSDFCYSSWKCHLQKFFDDSSIVGCIADN